MEENTDDEGISNEMEGSDMALEESTAVVQSPESLPDSRETCTETSDAIPEVDMGEAISSLPPSETESAVGEHISPGNQGDVELVHGLESMKESAVVRNEEGGQNLSETPLQTVPPQSHAPTPSVVSEEPTVDGNFKVLHI
jgi:hypothetical protein